MEYEIHFHTVQYTDPSIEQIHTHIPSRTIPNADNLIRQDLLPGLSSGIHCSYHPEIQDTYRLVTGVKQHGQKIKDIIFLATNQDKPQMTDDLLRSWCRTVHGGQDYQVWVLIERVADEYEDEKDTDVEEPSVKKGKLPCTRPNSSVRIKQESLDTEDLPSVEELLSSHLDNPSTPVQYNPHLSAIPDTDNSL